MDEVLNFFKDIGFTPGAAGIWLGLFYFTLKEWRENRKLSVDDRQAKREGFSKQVELLMKENKDLRASYAQENSALRAELVEAEKRHDEYRHACQRETNGLRKDVRHLEDELAGMKRTIAAQATSVARTVVEADIVTTVNAPTSIQKFFPDIDTDMDANN